MLRKVITFLVVFAVLFSYYQTQERLDRLEEKLDTIIQTRETVKYTEKDLHCLTQNVYYEAGIESADGKYAVAHVTLNRLKTGYWGNTVCKVVYAPAQFSWTLKKRLPRPDPAQWAESQRIAQDVLDGARVRILDRSLFYHADYIKEPHWADARHHVTQIGRHIFYNRAKNSWLEL